MKAHEEKIEKRNDITELVFILDRSGSMQNLVGDTIGGFNSMIEKQKSQPGKCLVSTVLFAITSNFPETSAIMLRISPDCLSMERKELFTNSKVPVLLL
jgi:hypothetical protein